MRKDYRLPLGYTFFGVLFLTACWSFWGQVCFGQQLNAELLKRRVTLHVKEGTLLEALERLAGDESIPIGWEVSQNDFVAHNINVDLDKTPLKDALDRIVLAEPSYRWTLKDGVINFYPVFDRDERLEKLLTVRIKQFNPPKGLSVFAFRDAILDLPEVQSFLRSNGLEGSHGGNCCSGGIPVLESEFGTANTELRPLLNKLIREGHRHMWALSRSGENREQVNLGL